MKRYNDKNCDNQSNQAYLKKIKELDENMKETEEKKEKKNLKNISFHRKNYILKTEILKENLNSNEMNSVQNYCN